MIARFKWTGWTFSLFLAVALVLWLWPSVFGGKVLLPLDLLTHNPPHEPASPGPVHNPLIGDMLYENYTWKLFQRRCLAVGELPLWNPDIFCGHPLYTTGQTSTFYPLNALFLIGPLPHTYAVFTGIHLFLGGVFTYLFCRRVGVGSFGAGVGGMIFALGGLLTARLVFPMLLASAIWLPLMLLWVDWMSEPAALARKTRGLLAGAVLFAQPVLGGFFEIAFYAYVACGLFALYLAGRMLLCGPTRRETGPPASAPGGGPVTEDVAAVTERPEGTAVSVGPIPAVAGVVPSRWRLLGAFLVKVGLAPVLAAVVCAPQILPFLEVMKLNVRAGKGDYSTAVSSALAGQELLTVAVPDALGNPAVHERFDLRERRWVPIAGKSGDAYYYGPKNYVEVGFYFGLLPLMFLVLSPAGRARHRPFYWGLLGIGLALALGTPLYKLFYYLVPGAEQVRTPFRWLYLSFFAAACLSAIGGQYWYDRLTRPAGRFAQAAVSSWGFLWLALLAATVVLLFVPSQTDAVAERLMAANERVRNTFATPGELASVLWVNALRLTLFGAASAVVLKLAWWRAWPPGRAVVISAAALALVALDLGQASYGFYTHADPQLLERRPPLLKVLEADHDLFRIGRYGPDKYLYSNLPSIYGLQDFGGYDSIILTDYATLLGGIEFQHLLKYNIIMTIERPKSLDSPLLPLLNIRYLLTRKDFEHPDWQAVPVEGGVKLYRVRPERELPRAFLVNQVQSAGSLGDAIAWMKAGEFDARRIAVVQTDRQAAAALVDSAGSEPGTARVTRYRPSSVEIETSAPGRRLLVLSDVMYPGWQASVDGRPASIVTTNGVFRGVSVPSGTHRVEFSFAPGRFRVGLIASGMCIVGLIVAGAGEAIRHRRRRLRDEGPSAASAGAIQA